MPSMPTTHLPEVATQVHLLPGQATGCFGGYRLDDVDQFVSAGIVERPPGGRQRSDGFKGQFLARLDTCGVHCILLCSEHFIFSIACKQQGIEVRGDIKLTEKLDALPPKKKRIRALDL